MCLTLNRYVFILFNQEYFINRHIVNIFALINKHSKKTEQMEKKKFISWRRVSTKKQGKTGLGLEAQKQLIDYFVQAENGELIADYSETYTGKDLEGCRELQKAMQHCREVGAVLIIAKTDRFRNTIEALQIYDEMNGKIYFCDLPHTDKFTLTLFFALAEREALLVSVRTKAALDQAKKHIKETGTHLTKNGKIITRLGTGTINTANAIAASAKSRRQMAQQNPNNVRFRDFVTTLKEVLGEPNTKQKAQQYVDMLNKNNITTSTGQQYDVQRFRVMCQRMKVIYGTI